MTTSPKRRTRFAWLIGGLLLLGVVLVVCGSRDLFLVHYYGYKARNYDPGAWEKLKEMGPIAIGPALDLLTAKGTMLGYVGGDILADIGEPAIPALSQKLHDKDKDVREFAGLALHTMWSRHPHLQSRIEALIPKPVVQK